MKKYMTIALTDDWFKNTSAWTLKGYKITALKLVDCNKLWIEFEQ